MVTGESDGSVFISKLVCKLVQSKPVPSTLGTWMHLCFLRRWNRSSRLRRCIQRCGRSRLPKGCKSPWRNRFPSLYSCWLLTSSWVVCGSFTLYGVGAWYAGDWYTLGIRRLWPTRLMPKSRSAIVTYDYYYYYFGTKPWRMYTACSHRYRRFVHTFFCITFHNR